MATEKSLLQLMEDGPMHVSLRALNQGVIDQGVDAEPGETQGLLNYWKRRGFIRTQREDKQENMYRIQLRTDLSEMKREVERRHALVVACLDDLLVRTKENAAAADKEKEEVLVQFSMIALQEALTGAMFGIEADWKALEKALLYLNESKVITLEDGFMVLYQRLNVERVQADNRKRYTLEDYGHLRHHYQNRVEQIHVVGDYARNRSESVQAAFGYVDGYFKTVDSAVLGGAVTEATIDAKLKNALLAAGCDQVYESSPWGFGDLAGTLTFPKLSDLLDLTTHRDIPRLRDVPAAQAGPRFAAWHAFRGDPDARWLALCLPRFLLRAPHDVAADPSRPLRYSESLTTHRDLLWGPAAILVALRAAESFAVQRWFVGLVGTRTGPELLRLGANACTLEVLLPPRSERALADLGLVPVTADRLAGRAILRHAPTVHRSPDPLAAQLPYVFLVSRLAHYLRRIQREHVGQWDDRAALQRLLDHWLRRHVA